MSAERFLVTGGTGCIGAWTVRNLLRLKIPTLVMSYSGDTRRLRLILTPEEYAHLDMVTGDISDPATVEYAIQSYGVTHIIHLAAMQLPFVKADPVRGGMVNVIGTINLFETAKKAGIQRLVYASSMAVYGPAEQYPEKILPPDARLDPRSHYGVFKQANEGAAKVYWLDDGISSIGLRPYVVYGPGRDQGMTSTPTKAMMAAVIEEPYQISFDGRYLIQYADDVAKIFIQAARAPFEGAGAFTLGGEPVSTAQIIACIEAVRPAMRGKLSYSAHRLPFPERVDDPDLRRVLGDLSTTPLQQGIAETIHTLDEALSGGKISRREIERLIRQ